MTTDANLYDLLRLWQQEVRKTADCLHEYNFVGAIECSNKAIAIGESVLSRIGRNSLEDDKA